MPPNERHEHADQIDPDVDAEARREERTGDRR